MAKGQNSPGGETPQDNQDTETTPTIVGASTGTLSSIAEPAKSFITDYMEGLRKAAKEYKDAADMAKTTAEQNLAGKKRHFNKAEKSVDVYENILNKNANLLAKTMEKVASEIDGDVAKAAEITKSLAVAKTAIQASKDKSAGVEVVAENLWDIVRRDLKSDPNVLKLREKMGKTDDKFNLDIAVEAYSLKIQDASDKINSALVEIGKINDTVSVDKLKELAKKTKILTDAYKTDITANLEFSKGILKKAHADLLADSAANREAQYNVDAGDNGKRNLTELAAKIGAFGSIKESGT